MSAASTRDPWPVTPDPAVHCWQENLAALRLADPLCAERLATLSIPDSVQPTTGRDGQPTWRIDRGGGQIEWFGHTSMPTVSAEGLLANFQPGGGNMVLAGIGSGWEAKLLAERLGRHQAVVVLETDPLNLALALRLWDISAALSSRQIVLLLAEDLTGLREQLLRLCQEQPGFEVPMRMLGWPWRSKAENQAYQGLIQEVLSQVQVARGQMLARQVRQLQQAREAGARPDAIAVLSGIPAIVTSRLAGWLVEGAQAAGMAAVACCAESPLSAGPLAGLGAAADLAWGGGSTPAWRTGSVGVAGSASREQDAAPGALAGKLPVAPDAAPGALADKLPVAPDAAPGAPAGKLPVAPDVAPGRCSGKGVQIVLLEQCRNHWPLGGSNLPVISWLVSVEPSGEGWQYPEGCEDTAVVSTQQQRAQLLAKGWPERRVVQVPGFVSPKALETVLDGPRDGVLLLSDLPPEDAEQAGVTLYSQKVLWDALRERLERQADSWSPDLAQRWLLKAQSDTGIDLADATVQEEFLGIVRDVLAPAVILRKTGQAILEAGLPLRVAGRGWDGVDWAKGIWDGLADDPQRRLELLGGVKAAVVGQCRPGPGWVALEAAAAGAAIMARELWREGEVTQLFEAGKQMVLWRTRQELTERLRHFLKNEASRMQMVQRARGRTAEEYAASVPLRRVIG